jgi:hypothetical protein
MFYLLGSLGLFGTAMGSELSCEEISKMQSIGLPVDAITQAMEGSWVREAVVDCLVERGLPAEVIQLASTMVQEPSAVEVQWEGGKNETSLGVDNAEMESQGSLTFNHRRVLSPGLPPGCSPADIWLLPEPEWAGFMSLAYGFGMGDVYAGAPVWGGVMAIAQVGVLAGGFALSKSGEPIAGMVLTTVGTLGLRVFDAVVATSIASSRAAVALDECTSVN